MAFEQGRACRATVFSGPVLSRPFRPQLIAGGKRPADRMGDLLRGWAKRRTADVSELARVLARIYPSPEAAYADDDAKALASDSLAIGVAIRNPAINSWGYWALALAHLRLGEL